MNADSWCAKCDGDVWLTAEQLHDGTWATVTVCQKCGHRVITLPRCDRCEGEE
jgi:DNA-directed RNA polymerase subunit RPC12/RpoP